MMTSWTYSFLLGMKRAASGRKVVFVLQRRESCRRLLSEDATNDELDNDEIRWSDSVTARPIPDHAE